MLMSKKINSNNLDNHKKEFERMIRLLREDTELKGIVKIYNELVDQLHNDKDRKKFNDSIK